MDRPAESINLLALRHGEKLLADSSAGAVVHTVGGAKVVDCGVKTAGSIAAGKALAEVCLAGLAQVAHSVERLDGHPCAKVTVSVEKPWEACLCSQYAGWRISVGDYFAMASGPMRPLAKKEPIFESLGFTEESKIAIGVLETSKLPKEAVVEYVCNATGVAPAGLTLMAARTASIAGGYQVVARSVETCLHKLHELGFHEKIVSGLGSAFLPPLPKDDLAAIGRTNDSILYGGEVLLWIDGSDDAIAEIGPKVPASASSDYGAPFAEIFRRYNGDFYKIDPLLFSPAVVVINNIRTGKVFEFGKTDHALLARSFNS
jgi:methenyltetrahydromethanopterin cyclohydrolase